jgi:hypothetical protein
VIYETDEDRAKEAEFALQIEGRFGCQLIKLGYDWQFDYLIARSGQLTGIAEAKCRTHASTKYDSVILSDHKTQYGFRFASKTLCYSEKSRDFKAPDFIFFVKFTDKAMYCLVTKEMFNGLEMKKLSAANHADDPTDTEYVRYIPIKLFKEF